MDQLEEGLGRESKVVVLDKVELVEVGGLEGAPCWDGERKNVREMGWGIGKGVWCL